MHIVIIALSLNSFYTPLFSIRLSYDKIKWVSSKCFCSGLHWCSNHENFCIVFLGFLKSLMIARMGGMINIKAKSVIQFRYLIMQCQCGCMIKLFSLFYEFLFLCLFAPVGMSKFTFKHCFLWGLTHKLSFLKGKKGGLIFLL